MQVPRLIAICLPRFLVIIPRFLVAIPRFLVAIPCFLVAIPRFLVAIPCFLVATIPQFPISCCYPSLPTAGHVTPHIWSSTRTPSFSTLTLGQHPRETSRSTRDCWPTTPSEKDAPIAVLSVCFPLRTKTTVFLPAFESICGPLGCQPDTIKQV